jgi:hypothetical protein
MSRRIGSWWIKDGLPEFTWIEDHGAAAFERLHYLLGFHGDSYTGAGQDSRGTLLAGYAAGLHDTFSGVFDMPVREAWAEANELVEGADVQWAYLRATSLETNTYQERLRAEEPEKPVAGRGFVTARGTC